MAIGAILALEGQGLREKYIVAGIDATPDALEFMKAGRLDVTVFQNAKGQGAAAIDTIVYVIAGIMYGIAAIILTARQESSVPSVRLGYDMEAITSAIIGGSSFSGGIGTIGGTVVGALIMGILANGMTMMQVNPNGQTVVKGAVIVAAVLFDMRKHRSK